MAIELPDVNVLIALFDPKHIHHQPAQAWFAVAATGGWATCPLTENGFLRVVSNPGYANLSLTAAQVAAGLRTLIEAFPHGHAFWPDAVSLRDTSLFDLHRVQGYRQLTDLYLLGLCQRQEAVLITFDGGIHTALSALVAPRVGLIRLLAP